MTYRGWERISVSEWRRDERWTIRQVRDHRGLHWRLYENEVALYEAHTTLDAAMDYFWRKQYARS